MSDDFQCLCHVNLDLSGPSYLLCLLSCYNAICSLYSRHSDYLPFSKCALSLPIHICLMCTSNLHGLENFSFKVQQISPIPKVFMYVSFAGECNYSFCCSLIIFLLCPDQHVVLFVFLNISVFTVAFLQNRSRDNVLSIFFKIPPSVVESVVSNMYLIGLF